MSGNALQVAESPWTKKDEADWEQALKDVPGLLTDLCWMIDGSPEVSVRGIKFLINELMEQGWEFKYPQDSCPTELLKPTGDMITWKYRGFIKAISKSPSGELNEGIGIGDCPFLDKDGKIDRHAERKAFSIAKKKAQMDLLPMLRIEKFIEFHAEAAKLLTAVSAEGQPVLDMKTKEKDKKGLCGDCRTPVICVETTYNNEKKLQWRNQSNNKSHFQKTGEDANGKPIFAHRIEAVSAPDAKTLPAPAEAKPAKTAPTSLPDATPAKDGGPPPVVPSDVMNDDVAAAMLLQLGEFYKVDKSRLEQLKAGSHEALKKFYDNATEFVRERQAVEAKA